MEGKWLESTIGREADILLGFAFKSAEFATTPPGFRLVRGDNVKRGTIEWGEKTRFWRDITPDLAKYSLREGDIVVGMDGSRVGENFARVTVKDLPALLVQRVACLRARGACDQGFLRYVVCNPAFTTYIKAVHTGTSIPHISGSQIGGYPFLRPPPADQRAIAHVLGTLDDKIELNRRTNETLEAMARALFKSWFVDFDPVRAKAAGKQPAGMDAETAALFPSEFVEAELGEIPKGWDTTTLGDAITRYGGAIQTGPFGSQLHASDYLPDGIPVVMPKDISSRRVSTASIARVGNRDAERLARHRLLAGDIVYSRRGDVEKHALISDREVGWLCGTGCLLVRLGVGWPSPLFASLALDRAETRAWISQHAIGATMPNLNTGILSAVPIMVPPAKVLHAFARAVDHVQALVVARDEETATLATTRDALLPRLLSGELRIPDAERIVGAAT